MVQASEPLVDVAHENLAHHVHGVGGRDPLAVFEAYGNAQALEGGRHAFAAAVHDHGMRAHQAQHHDVGHHFAHELGAFHGRPAVLD